MPDSKTVARALAVISKGGASHRYFFSKLNSPHWLDPLNNAGLFEYPPNAIKAENGGIIFPVWVEAEYLARMAPVAPQKVYDIMKAMKETDNFRVHHALARAASQMDVALAAKWAIRETKWIKKQTAIFFLLPEAYGNLAIHIASSGKVRVAVELMKATLAPSFKSIGFHGANHEAWECQELLRIQYPKFTSAVGMPALNLLCALANPAFEGGIAGSSDYSIIWRPAIEPSDQNIVSGDMTNAVIDAIRDTASALVRQGVSVEEVVTELEAHAAPIFRRFIVSLLVEFPSSQSAKRYVLDRSYFDDAKVWHEYSRLLSSVFPQLVDDEKDRVLAWIEAGPDTKKIEEFSADEAELAEKYRLSWKARRLSMIASHLSQVWRDKYESIVATVGVPPHADFLAYSEDFVGPSTPRTVDELEAMAVKDVASFLKTWRPSGEWHSAGPEGLGRALQAVVSKHPARFADSLEAFIDTDPTYARCILQGFEEAQGASNKFNWHAVLHFSLWVAEQSRGYVREAGKLDRDPHWGWARRSLMSLVRCGLARDTIQPENRRVVWDIIEHVADDPDPSPDDDRATSLDALTHGINTTRGQAAQAAIEYALWVRRTTKDDGKGVENFKLPSEVSEVLGRRLNAQIDSSPGVRAVIAEYFPYLHLLDEDWTTGHLHEIFPAHPKTLRDGAWCSYVIYGRPYAAPFRLILEKYGEAIDRLDPEDSDRYQERLGDHLLAMVGQGVLAGDDDDRLLSRYFSNVKPEAAERSLGSVGHAMRNTNDKVPSEVVDRFKRLWERLVETFGSDKSKVVMFKSFGRWFAAPQFDPSWTLVQLRRVIEIAGNTEVDFMVAERLAEIAVDFPSEAFHALVQLASGRAPHWELLGYRDSAVVILRTALRHPATRNEAELFIHELGRKGYDDFRTLISA